MAQPEFDTGSWPSMSARAKPGVRIPCDDERCTWHNADDTNTNTNTNTKEIAA
jgi:hypothetical protein